MKPILFKVDYDDAVKVAERKYPAFALHRKAMKDMVKRPCVMWDAFSFIVRSIMVHGDFYDYSKISYLGSDVPVCIIDVEMGETFFQLPCNHIKGCGSPSRASELTAKARRKTTESFILECHKKRNDMEFYDMSLVDYKGVFVKVKIIDIREISNHSDGSFMMSPSNFLKNQGSPQTRGKRIMLSKGGGKENMIKELNARRDDMKFLDFSKFNYKNASTPSVVIDTRLVGTDINPDFSITSNELMRGSGHPAYSGWKAQQSKINPDAPQILYYLKISTLSEEIFKVGLTNNKQTLKIRFENIMRAKFKICNIQILEIYEGNMSDCTMAESCLVRNRDMLMLKYQGQKFAGYTECFSEDIRISFTRIWELSLSKLTRNYKIEDFKPKLSNPKTTK